MQRPPPGVGASLRIRRRIAEEEELRSAADDHRTAVHTLRSELLDMQLRLPDARGHDAAALEADMAALEGRLASVQAEYATAATLRRRDMVRVTAGDKAYIRALRAQPPAPDDIDAGGGGGGGGGAGPAEHPAAQSGGHAADPSAEHAAAAAAAEPGRPHLVLFVRHFTQFADSPGGDLPPDSARDAELLFQVFCGERPAADAAARVCRSFFRDGLSPAEVDLLCLRARVDTALPAARPWFHALGGRVLPALQRYAAARPALAASASLEAAVAESSLRRAALEERFRAALTDAVPSPRDGGDRQAHLRRLRGELLRRRHAARCDWAEGATVALGAPAPPTPGSSTSASAAAPPSPSPSAAGLRPRHSAATAIAAADARHASLHDAVLRGPLHGGAPATARDAAELRALFRAMADGRPTLHPRQLAEVLTLFAGAAPFTAADAAALLRQWGADPAALSFEQFVAVAPRIHALAWDAELFTAMTPPERRAAIAAKRALDVPLAKYELRAARGPKAAARTGGAAGGAVRPAPPPGRPTTIAGRPRRAESMH